MSSGGLSKSRLKRMHDAMARHVERGELPGLVMLLAHRGEVHVDAIGHQSFGGAPMQRDALFRIASMTKPIAAVAAMILVEACRLRLDEPIDHLLPELAHRRVLRHLDGPLDDTVPAERAITLRDLLTMRMGFGLILEPSQDYPVQQAMNARGIVIGPDPSTAPGPDAWIQGLGTLPWMDQPGTVWRYHTAYDVLGILIARAAGRSLEQFLAERLFEPLGMKDTAFHVPESKLERLPQAYASGGESSQLEVYDDPRTSRWRNPPAFAAAGGGLVSTVDDYGAFGQMLLDGGRFGRERILSRPSVELMTTDQLTAAQKSATRWILGSRGWGFGVAIATTRDRAGSTPGQFGWDGGVGTSWASDPKEGLVGILMTQRLMDSPEPPPVFADFWTSAYQAIDD